MRPPIQSLTGRRWILRNQAIPADIQELATMLAAERGIDFIEGHSTTLSDPFLFPEMEQAVKRIDHAMATGETIGIFGDYDADGITATAQVVRFFHRRGIEPVVYLPDRLKEGYGMKRTSIDLLNEEGVTLLITVDTGITAHREIAHAKSLGIDVIITDHHRPSSRYTGMTAGKSHNHGERPDAYAVIHPALPPAFPNPHLCGSGVAFMLVRAMEGGRIWQGIEQDIVLAMIGTIGDIMPLTGENRILVVHGLKLIEKLPPCPLKDLLDSIGSGQSLTAGDIAFRVVPRLNAAGRMEHPRLALSALLTGGPALGELHRLNGDRQSAIINAMELIRPLVDWNQPFLFAVSPDVSPGIVGLVAGRLTDESGRPTLIASRTGDVCVASIRGIKGIDVMAILEHPVVRPHLTGFGGHRQAAGCTFPVSSAQAIGSGLSQTMLELGHTTETLLPEITLDRELSHSHLTLPLAKQLQSLEPFGEGNPPPLFLVSGLKIDNLKTVGTDATHLHMGFGAHHGIAFGLGSLAEQLAISSRIDVACSLGVNVWNGRENLQLMVRDIRIGS